MLDLNNELEKRKNCFEEFKKNTGRRTYKKEAYLGAKYSIYPFFIERYLTENGVKEEEDCCDAFYSFDSMGKVIYYYDGVKGYHYFVEYKPSYILSTVFNYSHEIVGLYYTYKEKEKAQYTEFWQLEVETAKKEVYVYNEEGELIKVLDPLDASLMGPIDEKLNYFEIDYDFNKNIKSLKYPVSYYGGGYLYYSLDTIDELKQRDKVIASFTEFFVGKIRETLESEEEAEIIELEFNHHVEYHTVLRFNLKVMYKAKREQKYEGTVYYNGEEYFTDFHPLKLSMEDYIDMSIYQQWLVRKGLWVEEPKTIAFEIEKRLKEEFSDKIAKEYFFKGVEVY